MMINEVIRFQNDIVLVFDEEGEQIPEVQGRYQDVRVKILARAPKGAKFFHGYWSPLFPLLRGRGQTWAPVSRKEW